MDALGWDSCDVIIVTGDAYVDHPTFGMAIIGRLLEAQGFRVGIIAQPDWHSKAPFEALGRPNLFFGVAAGNMDSMINRYTADRKYATTMPTRRAASAAGDPIGVRSSTRSAAAKLRRCADRARRHRGFAPAYRALRLLERQGPPLDPRGFARRPVAVRKCRTRGRGACAPARSRRTDCVHHDIRGTAFFRETTPAGWWEIDSTRIDRPGRVDTIVSPYVNTQDAACATKSARGGGWRERPIVLRFVPDARRNRARSVIRLPSFDKVRNDPVLYAHASRVLHLETNPGNARALVQAHGSRDLWLNPPPIPLSTPEMDYVFGLPYRRVPHPAYGGAQHSGVPDDPLFGEHHARLLRRLYFLFDHRARGPHHPEPLGGIDPRGSRKDPRHGTGLHRRHLGSRRPDGEHVPAGLQEPRDRVRLPAPELRLPRASAAT